MSTFYSVASSLVNFNDTISTISTSNSSPVFGLASKLSCKCDVHGPYSQINTEPFLSHGVFPAFEFFLPAKYTNHLLPCTRATKEASQFEDVVNICLSLLSAYWVLSAYFLAVLETSICVY